MNSFELKGYASQEAEEVDSSIKTLKSITDSYEGSNDEDIANRAEVIESDLDKLEAAMVIIGANINLIGDAEEQKRIGLDTQMVKGDVLCKKLRYMLGKK